MTPLIRQAAEYATQAHGRIDHRRKYSGQPYDAHLKSVAEVVRSATDDEQCIAAAWLHDTVEDTPATFADLEAVFGVEVTQLVRELTDISRQGDGNRAQRKAIDRAHLAAASPRAKTVKLADVIDNCRDICKHDPAFAKTYLFEARSLLEVLGEGNERLLARAHRELERCANRLGIGTVAPPAAVADADAPPAEIPVPAAGQPRALRLFVEAFTARDIAEPLRSFDGEADPARVHEVLDDAGLEVAGVRRQGRVAGYVRIEDLPGSGEGLPLRPFHADQLIRSDGSLSDVILILTRHQHCFVTLLGEVGAVITRADIQKPVARMWLFGIITMTEMNLAQTIRALWPDGGWCRLLSRGRLAKAEALFAERQRRRQHVDLVDCLQIADKVQILTQEEDLLKQVGFPSRSAAQKVGREFESLRNNLAHAQDIVTHDWPQIARMTQRIEALASH